MNLTTPSPSTEPRYAPLETRVSRSLQRVGFVNVHVVNLGSGRIRLTGTIPSQGDRAIAVAIARTVAQVHAVVSELGTLPELEPDVDGSGDADDPVAASQLETTAAAGRAV